MEVTKKSSPKHTNDDLKKMQAWSLEEKIKTSQTRIMEWYLRYDGNVYISFSGGKDSTVLLDLARRVFPDIPAVFIDTGLEYPELREFVKTKDNIVWLKPEMNFKQVINTYGYPLIGKEAARYIYYYRRNPSKYAKKFDDNSEYIQKYGRRYSLSKYKYLRDSDIPISDYCCEVMKKRPAKHYEKATGRKPILATMACESQIRHVRWLQNGCNAFEAKRPVSTPLSFWTEQDILAYLSLFQISYASVYGEIKKNDKDLFYTTGCDRTGCVFCGFGCHLEKEPNRFQRLKQTHPKLWDYCMRPQKVGGLGMQNVLETIGVEIE